MAKTFYASPTVACIYQGASDVINAPQNRLGDVFFHSNFKYWKSLLEGTTQFQVPGHTGSGTYGSEIVTESLVVPNPSGVNAPALAYDANTLLPFVGTKFQWATNFTRTYSCVPLSSGLYVRQKLWCANGVTQGAITLNIGYIFGVIT